VSSTTYFPPVQVPVSYSRITDFEKCPRYFYHKYIAKSFKEDLAAMSAGLQQHKQIEEFIRCGAPLPKHIAHLKDLIANLQRTHEWLEPEKELAVDAYWAPVSWQDWDHVYIRAKLDVIGRRRPGELTIIDWKSGKVSEGRDQMRLAVAVAMAEYPDTELVRAAYVWTQHRQSDHFVVPREEVEEIREHFDERAYEIQVAGATGNWRPRPSRFCKRCSVSPQHCEYKRR